MACMVCITRQAVSARRKRSYFQKTRHLLDDELVGHDGDVVIRNPLRCPDGALCGDERRATRVDYNHSKEKKTIQACSSGSGFQISSQYTIQHQHRVRGKTIGGRRGLGTTLQVLLLLLCGLAGREAAIVDKKAATSRFPCRPPAPCLPQRQSSRVESSLVDYLGGII